MADASESPGIAWLDIAVRNFTHFALDSKVMNVSVPWYRIALIIGLFLTSVSLKVELGWNSW